VHSPSQSRSKQNLSLASWKRITCVNLFPPSQLRPGLNTKWSWLSVSRLFGNNTEILQGHFRPQPHLFKKHLEHVLVNFLQYCQGSDSLLHLPYLCYLSVTYSRYTGHNIHTPSICVAILCSAAFSVIECHSDIFIFNYIVPGVR